MRYLGIDWGEKRIGLALGDDETKIASPFVVVATLEEVLDVIKEEAVDIAVIGRPASLVNAGTGNKKAFDDFVEKFIVQSGIMVEQYDERMSSKAADALVGDKKTKAERDAVAAMVILQDYLDKKK